MILERLKLTATYERPGGLIEDPQMNDRVGYTWGAVGAFVGLNTLVGVNMHLRAPHDNAQAQIDKLDQANTQLDQNDQHAQAAMIAGSLKGLHQHQSNMERMQMVTSQRADVANHQPALPFGTGAPEGIVMGAIPTVLIIAGTQWARLAIRGKQARELTARRQAQPS